MESDAALVRLARGGDQGALATLLTRHRAMLLALCRRALGDAAPAEDAAQEASLQALLGLDRLRRPDRFGPWLAGIGLNICRRRLREHWRNAWSWEALQGGRRAAEPVDLRPGPAELAEEADLTVRVRRAVAALPPGQRAAVLLFYLSGLTHAETAAALGVDVGAVKTRLHKARRALRRRLDPIWQEDHMTTRERGQPIPMRLTDVRRGNPPEGGAPAAYIVILQETGGERLLPIWIGPHEGTAMALLLEKVESQRPLTYAFAAAVLEAAGGRLREVRIERLTGDTFYASAVIEGPGGTRTVDARPSDALNLALVTGAPIVAQSAVLEAAAHEQKPEVREAVLRASEGAAAIVAAVQAAQKRTGC